MSCFQHCKHGIRDWNTGRIDISFDIDILSHHQPFPKSIGKSIASVCGLEFARIQEVWAFACEGLAVHQLPV
jgi:hypothetical protein